VATDLTSYHTPLMQRASLLVLPLRTRARRSARWSSRRTIPTAPMTEAKLPLPSCWPSAPRWPSTTPLLYTEQSRRGRKWGPLAAEGRIPLHRLARAAHAGDVDQGYTQLAKTLISKNDLTTSEEYLDIALDQIDRMSRLSWSCWTCRASRPTSGDPPRAIDVGVRHDVVHHTTPPSTTAVWR